MNYIPNCQLLTNKLGLLDSLQAYDRVCRLIIGRSVKMKLPDFIPETYRVGRPKEREEFYSTFQGGCSRVSWRAWSECSG